MTSVSLAAEHEVDILREKVWFLEASCAPRTLLLPHQSLQKRLLDINAAFQDTNLGSLAHSSIPMQALFTRKWTIPLFLAFVAICLVDLFPAYQFLYSDGLEKFEAFRLSWEPGENQCSRLEERYSNGPVFQLLRSGHPVSLCGAEWEHGANYSAVWFPESVVVNEIEVLQNLGRAYQFEARFNMSEWQTVGSCWPQFRWHYRGLQSLGIINSSDQSRRSLRMPRAVVLWMMSTFVQSVQFFLMSVCVLLSSAKLGIRIFLYGSSLTLVFIIFAIMFGDDPTHQFTLLLLSGDPILMIMTCLYERHLVQVLGVHSCFAWFNFFVFDYIFVDECVATSFAFSNGIISAMCSCGFSALRWVAVRRAQKLVSEDRVRYQAAWEKVLGDQDAELPRLKSAVQSLSLKVSTPARHLHRRMAGSDIKNASSFEVLLLSISEMGETSKSENRGKTSVSKIMAHLSGLSQKLNLTLGSPNQVDDRLPIQNLDQLYSQATLLCPILHSMATGWAEQSGGTLPLGKQGESTWTNLKRPDRAIQKALRTYAEDPSYILDICRCSLIFPGISSMVKCINCLKTDDRIVVVRIKSRMTDDLEAERSAGYRDVCINFRVVTKQTVLLGIENHVVEIQLLHRYIAAIKQDDGHKRYVLFRNSRCE